MRNKAKIYSWIAAAAMVVSMASQSLPVYAEDMTVSGSQMEMAQEGVVTNGGEDITVVSGSGNTETTNQESQEGVTQQQGENGEQEGSGQEGQEQEAPVTEAPLIAEQPESVTVSYPEGASFHVGVSDINKVGSMQWQISEAADSWRDLTGVTATTDTLVMPSTRKMSGDYVQKVRCAITDANGQTIYSDPADINIDNKEDSLTVLYVGNAAIVPGGDINLADIGLGSGKISLADNGTEITMENVDFKLNAGSLPFDTKSVYNLIELARSANNQANYSIHLVGDNKIDNSSLGDGAGGSTAIYLNLLSDTDESGNPIKPVVAIDGSGTLTIEGGKLAIDAPDDVQITGMDKVITKGQQQEDPVPTLEPTTEPTVTPSVEPTTEPTIEPTVVPEKKYVTLTLDPNGGTLFGSQGKYTPEPRLSKGDATLNGIGNMLPTREGYTFTGYYDVNSVLVYDTTGKAVESPYFTNGLYTKDTPLVVYALWEANVTPTQEVQKEYSLTLDPRGGLLNNSKNQYTPTAKLINGTPNLNNVSSMLPAANGYRFVGYYDGNNTLVYDENGQAVESPYFTNGIFTGNADLFLNAKWMKSTEKFTLTFESNGGSVIAPQEYDAGTVVSTFSTPVRSGYIFAGWYDALEGGNKLASVAMNSNRTIYAHWVTDQAQLNAINGVTGTGVAAGTAAATVTPVPSGMKGVQTSDSVLPIVGGAVLAAAAVIILVVATKKKKAQ